MRHASWLIGGLVALATILYLGTHMGWFGDSDRRQLRNLLSQDGAALIGDATIVGVASDPDYKPDRYYGSRPMTETAFRELAASLGIRVEAASQVPDAVWKLPASAQLQEWTPLTVSGAGLEGRGAVGNATVWLRWHGDKLYMVVLAASR